MSSSRSARMRRVLCIMSRPSFEIRKTSSTAKARRDQTVYPEYTAPRTITARRLGKRTAPMAKLAGLTLTSAEADFPVPATVTFTYHLSPVGTLPATDRPPLLIDPVGSVVVNEIDALTGWFPPSRTGAENW